MDCKQEGHKLSLSGIVDETHELAENSSLITGEIEVSLRYYVFTCVLIKLLYT